MRTIYTYIYIYIYIYMCVCGGDVGINCSINQLYFVSFNYAHVI